MCWCPCGTFETRGGESNKRRVLAKRIRVIYSVLARVASTRKHRGFSHAVEGIMNSSLWNKFASRVRAAMQECHSLGYHPTRFEQMLNQSDAVTLAKRMVTSSELQDGLKKLNAMGRVDLSVESIMLEPEFSSLFNPQELQAADWRLKQL